MLAITSQGLRCPPALAPGDRIAIVAPASPFAHDELDAGAAELVRLGFEPVIDPRVFARERYVSGPAVLRAAHLADMWSDASIAGIMCVRGGYGSVHLLPHLDLACFRARPKVFIGYSDVTALLTWLTLQVGIVAFHGPMIAGRLSAGPVRYDEHTLMAAVSSTEALGRLAPATLAVLKPGEAAGPLLGGTLTQLVASLGTPFAFQPPAGHVLFVDEVNERPYRLDCMLTQLAQAGVLARAAAIVFNELPGCDEPDGSIRAIDVVGDALAQFPGPVLLGFPSGHSPGAAMTLPFGVRARVVADDSPALVIEEPAVSL